MADPTKYSGWQEIQYKEWQKKVWPNTEEDTAKACGSDNTATANKNTSPTSSMDAITIDNNNKEEEEDDECSGSKSSHGWW